MMNQGGSSTDGSISQLDPNLLEKHQVGSANLGYSSVYSYSNIALPPPPPTSVSKDAPWAMHRTDNSSTDSGIYSNSSYHHDQPSEPLSRGLQDGLNASSHAATSSTLGAASGPNEYSGYTSYSSSTEPYNYGNTGYQGYYYGYQQQTEHSYPQQTEHAYPPQQTEHSYPQQTEHSYPQQVGGHQNSGAPYQSLTSFPNSGSYAGSTSYSSTYYNTGDYQTTGSYSSSGYSGQTNSWNDGNYASYQPHQYSSYTPADSNSAPTSSAVASTPLSYEQHCKQWADYYSQTASDGTCAPGTESISTTSTSTLDCQIPGVSGGYPISNSQPPPPGTTSWRPESSSSNLPTLQVGNVTGDTHDSYWRHGSSGFQSHHASQIPSPYQNPSNSNPVQYESSQSLQRTSFPQSMQYESSQSLQRTSFPQPNIQLPATHQGSQSYQSPLQTIPPSDTRRVSTLQIPTNPRIASSLALGLQKSDKDASTTDAAGKPAYISVSMPKSVTEVSSHDGADPMLKPGSFPSSLRTYVERALARCKDDSQKAACQNIMKEMITKASCDGTLFTQDWDTEPLFPLPDINVTNKDRLQISTPVSSLPKYKRSPSRRTKSRWEPIAEEKLVEKLASVNHVSVKDVSWDQGKEMEKVVPSGKLETKESVWNYSKFFQSRQQAPSKNAQRPMKKPRLGGGLNAAENGDASSDSDKEHGLTAYYSGAIALANSPEEKKKRENRFKRFDRGHRAETKHFRPKAASARNVYTRKASAMVLSRSDEDSASRAVEDIDWDSLTVKGTCQEIEKRYLRLTSAPDPTTVRPEEVLEKALLMVQNSQKNYLYKCDQLKSIRQDLTVQRIHNELTVKVYETHARLALEAGDLPEFNQCQSQLKNLYADGIKGCNMEFSAYSLLCVILHSSNNRDLVSSMARLSVEAKQDEAIKHALAVRSAVTSGNYVLFFRLYKTAPYLSTCLMDLYVEKMRYEAVKCMSRSYRPTVPLPFIAQVLGFTCFSPTTEGSEEKDTDGLEECEEWLKAHGACLIVDNSGEMQLDTKASSTSLYMPEPEDAVAHGDTSLAVNDFMTRTS